MKQAGFLAILVGLVLFGVAIATEVGNTGDVERDLSPPRPGLSWQLQAAIEGVIGFAFFIPGVAMVTHKQK